MRIETSTETRPSQAEGNTSSTSTIWPDQSGGSGGIRTPGTSRHARFQGPRGDVREQSRGAPLLVTVGNRCGPDCGEQA
jgi:hypothetical protein